MASFKINFTPTEKGKLWEMSQPQIIELSAAVCKAGSDVVKQHMRRTSPHTHLTPYVRTSRFYFTPSDGAFNNKVYFGGYFKLRPGRKYFSRYNKKGGKVYTTTQGVPSNFVYTTTQGVPSNFVSNIFYSGRRGNPFPIRDAFLRNIPKKAVESAMLNAFNKEMEKLNKE